MSQPRSIRTQPPSSTLRSGVTARRVVDTFDAAVDRGGVRGAYDVACCLAATLVG